MAFRLLIVSWLVAITLIPLASAGPLPADPASPLAVLTYVKVKPGMEEAFKKAVAPIILPSRTEPGNIAEFVQQSIDDSTEFVFYTRWVNEKALKDHLATPVVKEYIEKADSLTSAKARLVHYRPVDLGGGTKTADAFSLESNDLKPFGFIPNDFVYNGMDCKGGNQSPELHWKNVPEGTKSFAVTSYDPTAPTGSGFWHWIVVNIPSDTSSLKRNWRASDVNALEIANDFGTARYDGPCPPKGKPDMYVFTVHALNTKTLEIPANATNAFVRFIIEGATLQKASFASYYAK